jgi:hypothetical protein
LMSLANIKISLKNTRLVAALPALLGAKPPQVPAAATGVSCRQF